MKHKKVADIMTREVVAVAVDTSFHDLVRMLAEHRISGAPVLAPDGRVVGVVSEADLLGRQARAGGARFSILHLLRHKVFARKGSARTAADLRTRRQ
ncbi:CBS domain-containing protein [Nocardia vinacea]|uniref:CBS domain-containing protein n=1 Tax=Nocardia vinacea TaxID=96468 RepID=UPI0033CA1585